MSLLGLILRPNIWPWIAGAIAGAIVITAVVGYGNTRYSDGQNAERLRVAAQVAELQAKVTAGQVALAQARANQAQDIQTRTVTRTRIIHDAQGAILNAQDFDHAFAAYESAHSRLSDMSDARNRESWDGYIAGLGGAGHGQPEPGP